MSLPACGIDFGTSNSTAAICVDGRARLLPLEDGKTTLPSAVFFNLDESSLAVGRAALREYLEGYDGRLMRALKSLLGSSLMDAGTEIGGRLLPFRDLIGQFIGELRRRAEAAAGQGFEAVVVGRPVRFVDEDAAADRLAEDTLAGIVTALGFKEVSFQYEPIAAAHAYEQDVSREELVLVVDIGGGTSDFSLLRLSPERRRAADRSGDLLGNSGVHIGGTNFDRQMMLANVMPQLGMGGQLKKGVSFPNSIFFQLATWHTINQAYSRKTWQMLQQIAPDVVDKQRFERLLRVVQKQFGHRLAMDVEAAKIELSSEAQTLLDLDEVEPGLSLCLSRKDFERSVAEEITRIVAAARDCLAQAGIAPEELDTLFFTGGCSAVPALRQALAEKFAGTRVVEGDLYGSVGCGLAVVAEQRYG